MSLIVRRLFHVALRINKPYVLWGRQEEGEANLLI